LIRLKPELQAIKTKFSGKNFAFFNTESVYDSNLFASWNRPDQLKNKNFGIGFGGSNKMNCRLWIDQSIANHSYVNYRDSTYFDGSLLYSLDRLIKDHFSKQQQSNSNEETSQRSKSSKVSEEFSSPLKTGPRDPKQSTPFPKRQVGHSNDLQQEIGLKDFPIEVTGVEAWALMTQEKFNKFNAKLAQLSTFNHYDKMVGINYEAGTKDAEVIMAGTNHFDQSD